MSGYCVKAMLGHSYFHWTTNMKYTVGGKQLIKESSAGHSIIGKDVCYNVCMVAGVQLLPV